MKQEKIILGISAFNHDSSACLIHNGEIVAFCEEERLDKKKHSGDFPSRSIAFSLEQAKITVQQITDIAFYFNPRKCLYNYLKNNNILAYFFNPSLLRGKRYYYEMVWLLSFLVKIGSIRRYLNGCRAKIIFIDHHIAHSWYAYYASRFDNCTVLSNDSIGESVSSCAVHFSKVGNTIKIQPIFNQYDPHSLGYLYGAITEYLGFKRGSEEGKVMAMAAYGKSRYLKLFRRSIKYLPGGRFRLDSAIIRPRTFQPKGLRISDDFIARFGPYRLPGDKLTQRHFDIAYAMQKITESVLKYQIKCIDAYNIALSGGVAQNSSANGKLKNIFPNKNIFIPPIPNDAGCSIGSAINIYYKYYHRLPKFTETAFLGPSFKTNDIIQILKKNKIKYRLIKNIALFVSDAITENKVVAIYRDKMECGPRALGHRSIICSPTSPKMKDFLNKEIKNREFFQPYGGIIMDKDVKKVFRYDNATIDGPYMSFVFPINKKWLRKIPSLVHFDNTSRIQIMKNGQDKFIENLLYHYQEKTGIPLIINTSLNLRGQPIALSPQDALNVFINSGIDNIIFNDSIVVSKYE